MLKIAKVTHKMLTNQGVIASLLLLPVYSNLVSTQRAAATLTPPKSLQSEFIGLRSVPLRTLVKMPEKHIPPKIERFEDFDVHLSGSLNPNKTLALLLDYDGTLAPIADHPDKTIMSIAIEAILNKLAKNPNIFLVIISGRAMHDLKNKIGINGITYAGNHGLEIESKNNSRHDYPLSDKIQENYNRLVIDLQENAAKNNAWVEDKKMSLTFHYRAVPVNMKEDIKQTANRIIEKHGYIPNPAHECIEAKPPVIWNKGEASVFLLKEQFGEDWPKKVNVVFVGDDTTDEDAMRKLQGIGKSFRISSDPDIQTFADFRLVNQDLVGDLLNWISNTYENEE